MLFALIIIYVVTLVYLAITERFRYYASLIAVQGWVLFGIAILRMHTIDWGEFAFILVETLVFKAIVVPNLLFRIIRRTGVARVHEGAVTGLNSLLLFVIALLVSAGVAYYIADTTVNVVFLAVAIYAVLCGLILIVTRKRIFSHLIGFLVIENGVFLFSMAVGVEMPMLVNSAMLLDVLMSVLMLGVFFSKLGQRIQNLDSDELTLLKD
jgi:hydrogenase-4 component E